MNIFGIDGCRVQQDTSVESESILPEVFVAAAYRMAPPADRCDLGSGPKGILQPWFIFFVGEPDGIVEIVDDLLPEHLCDEPFCNRRADGCNFPVNEDMVICGYREEDKKSTAEALDQKCHFFEGISSCIEDAPGAFGEETLELQLVSMVCENAEVLFEPEPLGGGLSQGVRNEKKNSGHDDSGSCK